jgi:SnoaL-like domain
MKVWIVTYAVKDHPQDPADTRSSIGYVRDVHERSVDLARRWTDAYRAYRDEELVALAHPAIVLRPRRGQGEQDYRGLDGVRRWLADAGTARPETGVVGFEMLEDGRVLAETRIGDAPVIALFEVRDDRISAVSVYLSDRELLQHVGVIREAAAQGREPAAGHP